MSSRLRNIVRSTTSRFSRLHRNASGFEEDTPQARSFDWHELEKVQRPQQSSCVPRGNSTPSLASETSHNMATKITEVLPQPISTRWFLVVIIILVDV